MQFLFTKGLQVFIESYLVVPPIKTFYSDTTWRNLQAMEHIFGFMIYNDFSARAIQSREMAVGLGPAKGKDFIHGHVFGPALVTMDDIPDVYDMPMQARVNGELRCDANSGTIHWKFADMIAHGSLDEYIVPGEVFESGTVGGGAGAEIGRFLARGDTVELSVTPLGVLRNTIR